MNKVALAFLTKDRVELTKRTVEPLLQPEKFDLWWFDGSKTSKAQRLADDYPACKFVRWNVGGGPDYAIITALCTMLKEGYSYVGICESDVKLHPDFFGPTMALFDRGLADGIKVGAVSARAYEDRVLFTRDGYSVMHNLGAGFVIFSRYAARLLLDAYRTHWTFELRKIFALAADLDIAKWYAFRGGDHAVTVDWSWDATLTRHGLASLALTPSPVEMIGQNPPLHEQGLKIVDKPVELLRNDDKFARYVERMHDLHHGNMFSGVNDRHFNPQTGETTIFCHQLPSLGAQYGPDDGHLHWTCRWVQGFGPFAFVAVDDAIVDVPIYGSASFMVSGGKLGGQVHLRDGTGYSCDPYLPPDKDDTTQMLTLPVKPATFYRTVSLTFDPGTVFHGISTREPQPRVPFIFDATKLPPA